MEGSGNFGRFLCVFSIVLPAPEGAFYFLPLLERVYQNVFYFIFLQCTNNYAFLLCCCCRCRSFVCFFWYRLIVVCFLIFCCFVTM